jgi:hypothetical protein
MKYRSRRSSSNTDSSTVVPEDECRENDYSIAVVGACFKDTECTKSPKILPRFVPLYPRQNGTSKRSYPPFLFGCHDDSHGHIFTSNLHPTSNFLAPYYSFNFSIMPPPASRYGAVRILLFCGQHLHLLLLLGATPPWIRALTPPPAPPTSSTTTTPSTPHRLTTAGVTHRVSRETAQEIIQYQLLPHTEYSERIGWGRDAQGLGGSPDVSGRPLTPQDPRLSRTYAEFPLFSMDVLLDLGLHYMPQEKWMKQQQHHHHEDNNDNKKLSMLDVGSGCGRLVFYAAMTRGSEQQPWNVQGIEISSLLHERGLDVLQDGMARGLFFSSSSNPTTTPAAITTTTTTSCNSLSLYVGAADQFATLFKDADLVFAYSTAFSAQRFSPELGALIMDPEWSELLGNSCSKGCIAITTDRALDPDYGWELIDRRDVENPDVFGTTGYIHIKR